MNKEYERLCQEFQWKLPPRYNLGEALCGSRGRGSDTAVVIVDRRWNKHSFSYHYLSEQSDKLASRLVEGGARPGDRVGVMLEPSIEAAVAFVAILKAGMLAMPLNTESPVGSLDQLAVSGARTLLTSRELADVHASRWSALSNLSVEVIRDARSARPGELLEQELSRCRSGFSTANTTTADPAIVAFTSGSEGAPKGVVQPHGIVLGTLPALIFMKLPRPADVVWSNFGWGWLGGLMVALAAWHCGAAVLIEEERTIAPTKTVELLRRFGASRISVSPTALKMLRSGARSARYPMLTSVATGGEKLGPGMREWVRSSFGTELCEAYGMSECSGVIGSGHVVEPIEGALGKPAPGMEVCIVSESGSRLGPGEIGVLAIRAPHPAMFLGYWQDEAATREKFCGTLLKSGDLALQDDNGYFWYVSRADDVIKSGGKRIGPNEIEAAFLTDPAVKFCAAVGVPDALAGETVVLWVQLNTGVEPSTETERNLIETARRALAPYQLPRRIRFVDAMPMTSTGKIRRAGVKEAEIGLRLATGVKAGSSGDAGGA